MSCRWSWVTTPIRSVSPATSRPSTPSSPTPRSPASASTSTLPPSPTSSWIPPAAQPPTASVPSPWAAKSSSKKRTTTGPHPASPSNTKPNSPTASSSALNNLGQQFILLVNHHYGPTGDLDLIANASIVQANCPHGPQPRQPPCSYGGQQAVSVSFHVTKSTRLYGEAFAQNVSQSNTPPGTYLFGGFYHPFSNSFGLDGGVRFGVSRNSASIGTTIGLVFGKKL